MLANVPEISAPCGEFSADLHKPFAFLHGLLDFIADELPRWRDDPDRPKDASETALTEYLCDHLSGATRMADCWDVVQFRTEAKDQHDKSRKLDIAPKPRGACIFIDGRRHTQYDPLMPIECKRLPTPKGTDRDEREYVFSQHNSTGGIQRFKAGHHGGDHSLGAMIGYIQEGTTASWHQRISGWINELGMAGQAGWTDADVLSLVKSDDTLRTAVLNSVHSRSGDLPKIELRHLWLNIE